MENVKLFLDACKIIGVDPVFNPNDLIEKRLSSKKVSF